MTTAVWVRLDAIYIRNPDAPSHTIADGLDMTGQVPGVLIGWWPTVKGNWLGVVNYAIPYADGRRHKLQVNNQLIPDYALRKREDA